MDFERARAVIRALLAKTEDRGCTEEEAASATKKAFELMEKYQVEMSDTEIEEEGAEHKVYPLHSVRGVVINMEYAIKPKLAVALAIYTNCKLWQSSQNKELHAVGTPGDLVLFEELLDSLTLRAYYLSGYAVEGIKGDSRTQRGHYILGFINAIHKLVRDEQAKAAAEFKKTAIENGTSLGAVTASGTSLILVKNALVEAKYKEVAPKDLIEKKGKSRKVGSHYAQGVRDGLTQRLQVNKKLT